MTAMKIKSIIGFVFKSRALGARLTPPPNYLDCGGKQSATPLLQRGSASQSGVAAALCHRTPKSSRHFVRSFGNPGCCGWDTRAPFHLPAESNCSRSCPHHGATPAKRLIKRWVVGVKKVLRKDLSKKTLPAGHRNQPQNAAGLNTNEHGVKLLGGHVTTTS
jgi:hypothetical protein